LKEQKPFHRMTARSPGEKLLDHWKRRKAMLEFPNKKALVSGYEAIEKKKDKLSGLKDSQAKHRKMKKLEAEFREITSLKYVTSQRMSQKKT
jgi:hypothetical protein